MSDSVVLLLLALISRRRVGFSLSYPHANPDVSPEAPGEPFHHCAEADHVKEMKMSGTNCDSVATEEEGRRYPPFIQSV